MNGLESGDVLPSGRYCLGAPVPNAKGAFGQVFEGEVVGGEGERLAIKKIIISAAIGTLLNIYPNLPNPRQHLAREWRASLLSVQHPNLCRTHAVEFTDEAGRQADLATGQHAFLVMEWAGEALIDVVLKRGGLDEAEAREYFWQIIIGIVALHKDGYSHRDIKPENITLLAPTAEYPQGLIKIVDFGLAKSESEGPLTSNVGTERYKAPEISPGASYDSKVDVWSLGCTLYEMLTAKGSLANRQNGIARMAKAQYKKGEMPLARALISRCLTPNPGARPSCLELLADPFFQGRALPVEPEPEEEPEEEAVADREPSAADSMTSAADSMTSAEAADEAADFVGASMPSWAVETQEYGTPSASSGTLESWTEEEHAADVILNLRLPERDARHLIDEGARYQDLERIGAGTDDEFVEALSDSAIATIKEWHGREQTLVAAKYMDAAWAAQVATPGPRSPRGSEASAIVGGAAAPAAAAAPAGTAEEGVPPASSDDQELPPYACAVCTLQNSGGSVRCAACDAPRGAKIHVAPVSREAARADAATMKAIEEAVASSES